MNNKENEGYNKEIKKVWDIKEKIFIETQNMDFKEYCEYVENNISDLKNKLKR